ncbi:MAG TPA: ATP synthase F1 subunit delta [Candidatus Eisenbacteria bacterium]|jgi:F-type H+-transporting ATPase subunit delta|nr:ATP synthase F1 subunit delta [Candidatus Eisenbacteria bacterium]
MALREQGLAERYAEALLGAAEKRNAVDAVAEDLQSLTTLDEKDSSFRRFLESPAVRDDAKRALVESVLGSRTHPLTMRFVLLLMHKKRIRYLRDAAAAYRALVEEKKGIVHARVTSAVALGEDEKARLGQALEHRTGLRFLIEPHVDESLLGGVRVQYRDQILDDSVRTRLLELRDRLLAVEV